MGLWVNYSSHHTIPQLNWKSKNKSLRHSPSVELLENNIILPHTRDGEENRQTIGFALPRSILYLSASLSFGCTGFVLPRYRLSFYLLVRVSYYEVSWFLEICIDFLLSSMKGSLFALKTIVGAIINRFNLFWDPKNNCLFCTAAIVNCMNTQTASGGEQSPPHPYGRGLKGGWGWKGGPEMACYSVATN